MGAGRADPDRLAHPAPPHRPGLRPPRHDLRDIFDALLYLDRTGAQWRYLPHDFPPWPTVYGYFAHWQRDGVLHQLHGFLHRLTRQSQGRAVEPGAGALDTQSVKTSNNVPRTSQGADVGKRIVGRKRGAVTDSLGLLLTVLATAAGRSDSAIAPHLLDTVHAAHPRLRKMWADSAFRTTVLQHAAHLGIDLEVVQRTPGTKGFTPPPRRWVIERTYGWFMIFRRLARDHETLTVRSEALIELRMIDLMTRRLTGESTPTWRDPTPLNETPSPG